MKATIGRRILLALLLLACLAALARWGGPLVRLFQHRESIELLVKRWGAWGPLVIILLQVAQTLLAPVPGQVIGFASGYLYGVWLGTLYCMIGTLLGTLITLILVRRYGRPLVDRLANPGTVRSMDEWMARHGLDSRRGEMLLFLIYIVPFTPSDVANMIAGLTSMPVGRVMLLATIGRFPGVLVPTLIGAGSIALNTWQWVVLIALSLVAALIFTRYGEEIEERMLDLISWARGRFGG